MPTENRIYIDPESRLNLNLYAKPYGSVTVPHSTGTIEPTELGNGYYEFPGLDTALAYTVYEEAVAGTKAATDEWLAVLGINADAQCLVMSTNNNELLQADVYADVNLDGELVAYVKRRGTEDDLIPPRPIVQPSGQPITNPDLQKWGGVKTE